MITKRYVLKNHCSLSEVAQSCPTLCDPMDCRPPGSCVHEVFQAEILEWVVISYSRVTSRPRDWTPISCGSCIGRRILNHCATCEAPKDFQGVFCSVFAFSYVNIQFLYSHLELLLGRWILYHWATWEALCIKYTRIYPVELHIVDLHC